jgi:hypothetical protein
MLEDWCYTYLGYDRKCHSDVEQVRVYCETHATGKKLFIDGHHFERSFFKDDCSGLKVRDASLVPSEKPDDFMATAIARAAVRAPPVAPSAPAAKDLERLADVCGKHLTPEDRKVWGQAVAMLLGLKIRNGFGEKDLAGAVGMALRRGRQTEHNCEDCGAQAPSFGLPLLDERSATRGRPRGDNKKRWCAGCAKAHAGAVNVGKQGVMCERCGLNQARFGLPADKKARWCGGCAKRFAEAVNKKGKKCEGCGLQVSSFGLLGQRKMRWCSGCAKRISGAVNIVDIAKENCEDCGRKQPCFGLMAEWKKRWCVGCAKVHKGAVNVVKTTCEDCRLKPPSFGLPVERKKRWCVGCAKAHAGAVRAPVSVVKKTCEDCRLNQPSFGLPADKKARWCGGCAKRHVEAVKVAGAPRKKPTTAPKKRKATKPLSRAAVRESGLVQLPAPKFVGICWIKGKATVSTSKRATAGKWRASISIKGKTTFFGHFEVATGSAVI